MQSFQTFSNAIARTPPQSMSKGITTQKSPVDINEAHSQHQRYLATLKDLGIAVHLLDPIESLPDCHFVEDTAVMHQGVAVLTKPGAQERQAEVEHLRKALPASLSFLEIEKSAEAVIDGGDVILLDDIVLIGISYRTNIAGAEALTRALQKINPQLTAHFIEFAGVLHLKSGLTALNKQLFLGNPRMQLQQPLPFGEIIWVPDAESYAANALIANGAALVFAECKTTQAMIKAANLQPIPLVLSEFRKMDGSFTCLSLLW